MTIRWGLCCQFTDKGVQFRQATNKYVASLGSDGLAYLSDVVRSNAIALFHAVERCVEIGAGAFRINFQILPLATHPVTGYSIDDLIDADTIKSSYMAAGAWARARGIRLSFHPDQFVVLNSERSDVVAASQKEVEHQASVAKLIGADTICLHGGGVAGDKKAAIARLYKGLNGLSDTVLSRLAFENDDRSFSPSDLLPVCEDTGLPFIYDVHHHRCLDDGLSVPDVTARAMKTWTAREPYFHISSPRDGWASKNPRPHADYLDHNDFPDCWRGLNLTVDLEAKAKELAVAKAVSYSHTFSW